jgi:hypothetical protein
MSALRRLLPSTSSVGGAVPREREQKPAGHHRTRFHPGTVARSRLDQFGPALLVVIALLSGGLLRLWGINRYGVNSDEAVYLGQAAALAQEPILSQFFPLFRAHPLLFPFLASLTIPFFGREGLDLAGRLLAVCFGLATIGVTMIIGRLLYGRWVGAVAALFVALMPYHISVTRQALLDGPMAFWVALVFLAFARYAATRQRRWLVASTLALGLAFLTKETAVIFLGALIVTLAIHPQLSDRPRDLLIALAAFVAMIAVHPFATVLAGGSGTERTTQYLVWQLFRRPNHEWWFYLWTIPPALGPALVALALLGLWLVRHVWSWRETMLVAWLFVPFAFFQAWPTKGFPYLVAIVPAAAILGARTLARFFALGTTRPAIHHHFRPSWLRALGLFAVLAVAGSLALPSVELLRASTNGTFLAGSGGVPGGREAGMWVREHTPQGTKLLTIGPSMANIIQFYGYRKAYGLSVSPNPLHRNPTYEPVVNPDLFLRNGEIQYVVWDAYSAARSPFFAEKLLTYARRYHGRVVHTQTVRTVDAAGQRVELPVIVIYEVRP